MSNQFIQNLKKGDLIHLPGKKVIYTFDGYCRTNRLYQITRYDDVSTFRYLKKNTIIQPL